MSAIAGIDVPCKVQEVQYMLDKMAHRGPAGQTITQNNGATIGISWTQHEEESDDCLIAEYLVLDSASGEISPLVLRRDPLGTSPIYYGWTSDNMLCFASEVKALLPLTREVFAVPPGHTFDGFDVQAYFELKYASHLNDSPEIITRELQIKLRQAVEKHIGDGNIGAWLSGGLDSSAMAALARLFIPNLHTFAAGIAGSPDLEFARVMADHIHSQHHEVIVDLEQLLAALPKVIYYLESFDALLVRSSITNYLVARLAAEFVPAVYSGEGGDELFAGYEYLKTLDIERLPNELLDITRRLHNTALQRVDRSAAAHGINAYVPFLETEVVEYALSIPAAYKLHDGVEKWILREAVAPLLPPQIAKRPKAKFWEGAGVQDLLARYAEERISNYDFTCERVLPNGWRLNSKEELLYYRIFRQYFGEFDDLSWMGRTKGAPVM